MIVKKDGGRESGGITGAKPNLEGSPVVRTAAAHPAARTPHDAVMKEGILCDCPSCECIRELEAEVERLRSIHHEGCSIARGDSNVCDCQQNAGRVWLAKAYNGAAARAEKAEARVAEADACLKKLGIVWSGRAYIGFDEDSEREGEAGGT